MDPSKQRSKWWQVVPIPNFKGLCSRPDVDKDIFFDWKRPSQERAIAICDRCPARRKCRNYALKYRIPYGIFGGTTPEEREEIHGYGKRRRLFTEPWGDAEIQSSEP